MGCVINVAQCKDYIYHLRYEIPTLLPTHKKRRGANNLTYGLSIYLLSI